MISAIILAAGESKRMGRPKMLLPWGSKTVIEHVVTIVRDAGVEDIVVITGGAREAVEAALPVGSNVRAVFNPDYFSGEMLSSIQRGLRATRPGTRAALVCLGDQPQVREGTVRQVCAAFLERESRLVVPSYRMHRGHPWLVARPLWSELLDMQSPHSPRDFLNSHSQEITYVEVDHPSVIEDLDTPEDYRNYNLGEL